MRATLTFLTPHCVQGRFARRRQLGREGAAGVVRTVRWVRRVRDRNCPGERRLGATLTIRSVLGRLTKRAVAFGVKEKQHVVFGVVIEIGLEGHEG